MQADQFQPREWRPGEKPLIPGSPSNPPHPTGKRIAFGVVGLIVALTGGLGNALVTANLVNLQGTLGVYASEMQWLPAAYVMTTVSMNLLLVKFRQQYGLRRFTEIFLVLYALVTFGHLFAHNLATAVAVRAAHGMAGAALSTLGLYYTLQAFPAAHRPKGVVLGIGFSQLALPLARIFSTGLLSRDEWRGLIWFELGMALLALGCVLMLKLPPGERSKAFEPLDFVTFALFAPGVALLCAVLALGRTEWWFEARWIAYALIGAVLLVTTALAIEHNRERPLLNIGWLTTARMTKLALAVLLVRIVQSEATGVVGFLQALNLSTDQMQQLFVVVLAGSVAGLAASALTIKPTNLGASVIFALVLMTIGALMDAHATSDTRPANMYVSQFLLAFGGVFFLGPTLLAGIGAVVAEPRNIISFTVMFSMTQNLGGLLGSAIVGTFQVVREKYHSSYIVEHLTMLDPDVVARLGGGAARYAGSIADPAARSAVSLSALGAAATREANVMGYNDVFMMIAAIAIATIAWIAITMCWSRLIGAAPAPPAGVQPGGSLAKMNVANSETAQ